MAKLRIVNSVTGKSADYFLQEEVTRVGRGDGCEIQIFSPYVSRTHLQIQIMDNVLDLADLGSTNGFRLNGIPQAKAKMKPGDQLTIGDVDIFLEWEKGTRSLSQGDSNSNFEVSRKLHFIELGQKLLSQFVTSTLEADERFIESLPLVNQVLGNERFFLFQLDAKASLKVLMAFENGLPLSKEKYHRVPVDFIKKSVAEGSFFFINNAAQDAVSRSDLAFSTYGVKSCAIFPFVHQSANLALYFDSTQKLGKYFPEHSLFFENFGLVYGLYLNLRVTQRKLKEEISKSEYLQRYLSVNVKSKLMDEFKKTKIGGTTKLVTILFSDIRGFTKLSEKQPAETVVRMLNVYFSAMTEIIYRYGGTVDKFMGDAIMAHWGAFVPMEDQVNLALQTAIEMQHRLQTTLHQQWAMEGLPIFSIGIGIHTDNVISGNIGSEKRMEFTVIGDGVNLASRIQGLTEKGEIIISERTYLRAKSTLKTKKRDPETVKGKEKPIITYLVTHTPEEGRIAEPVPQEGQDELLDGE